MMIQQQRQDMSMCDYFEMTQINLVLSKGGGGRPGWQTYLLYWNLIWKNIQCAKLQEREQFYILNHKVWMPSIQYSWQEIKLLPHLKLYSPKKPILFCNLLSWTLYTTRPYAFEEVADSTRLTGLPGNNHKAILRFLPIPFLQRSLLQRVLPW